MIGETRFTYTDRDITAALGAGWTWFARPRNLLVAYVIFAAFNVLLAGLGPSDEARNLIAGTMLVILAPAVEVVLTFGALYLVAWKRARRVLHSRYALAFYSDKLRGEQVWAWDGNALRVRYDRGRADLAWSRVGAWLDTPEVLLLYSSGGWAFAVPAPEWHDAPKVILYPYGGSALALPKRALVAGDAGRLLGVLRAAGVPERRRFGLIAAKGVGPGR